LLAVAALAALAVVTPALPSSASGAPATTAAETEGDDVLTIFSDYQDHAVVETIDLETGARHVVVERGRHVDEHGDEHAHGDDATPADGGDDTVEASAVSTSVRCSNSGTWNYIGWGNPPQRVRRPWRMIEEIALNPSGAPSLSFDWRTLIRTGSNIWKNAANPCELPDTIGWVTPPVGDDTSADPENTSDGVNAHGWKNFGGWSNGSILLGRTYLRSNSVLGIVEGGIHYNSHPDAKWCNGSCADGWDFRSVAAHEWGHYLGLGHVCGDSDLGNPCNTAAEEGAVMYPYINQGEIQNRTLSKGDIQGATDLYPAEWGYEVTGVTITNPAGDGAALTPGRTYDARVTLRNAGLRSWNLGSALHALKTAGGLASPYADASWVDASTPSYADEDLTRFSHSGLPGNDETVIITDEQAAFDFTVTVPFSKEPPSGTLADTLATTLTGASYSNPATATLDLPVGSIALEIVDQSGPTFLVQEGVVVRGQQSNASLTVRNAGTAPWFPGDDLIRLVVDPGGACSPFQGNDWETCEVVSSIDGAGSVVNPDEWATFTFRMSNALLAPLAGPRTETMAVEWRGRPTSRLEPTATWSFVAL
ncbi:MAG TPA: matrixin family metalloprotease, partial [Acidimicrobiia bacterium]|nr:matrixin family metalloprotease [Acidimicrobiia bacterium]